MPSPSVKGSLVVHQMGVHEEHLVWLAARVRQIRAELSSETIAAGTLTTSPEDASMQEYHRRAQASSCSGASYVNVLQRSGQDSISQNDTSTVLDAEKDLQTAQGSSASLRSTAGQQTSARRT
jgi:hypothetical protein